MDQLLKIKKITGEGDDLVLAKTLFAEYIIELNVNLDFQKIDAELGDPLAKYGFPRGALLLAYYDGQLAGCVGVAPHPEGAAGECEMKRLFVRPDFRRFAIGKALALAILEEAKALGYERIVLDTLERLGPAVALYQRLGFRSIEPYYANPLSGVIYMEKYL